MATPTVGPDNFDDAEAAGGSSHRSSGSDVSLWPITTCHEHREAKVVDARKRAAPAIADEPLPKRRSGPRSKTSIYLGVTKYKRTGKWEAHIWWSDDRVPLPKPGTQQAGKKVKRGCQLHVGSFQSAEDAGMAYDRAAYRLRGPKAAFNFPEINYKEDWFIKDFGNLSRKAFVEQLRLWAQDLDKGKSADLTSAELAEPCETYVSCPSVIAWQKQLLKQYMANPQLSARSTDDEDIWTSAKVDKDAASPHEAFQQEKIRRSSRIQVRHEHRGHLPRSWTQDHSDSDLANSDDDEAIPNSHPPRIMGDERNSTEPPASRMTLQEAWNLSQKVSWEPPEAEGEPSSPAWHDVTEGRSPSPSPASLDQKEQVWAPGAFLLGIAKCAMEAPSMFGSLLSRKGTLPRPLQSANGLAQGTEPQPGA